MTQINLASLQVYLKYIRIDGKALEIDSSVGIRVTSGGAHIYFVVIVHELFTAPKRAGGSPEGGGSGLKIIKNRLRTTQKQKRLESLMIISTESDIAMSLDLNALVCKFADAAPRRLKLK